MGWLDEGIQPSSHADARAAADALHGDEHTITDIVCSPLRRARETAEPLARLCGIEPRLDDRAGELHVGPWEGLYETEIAERWPDEWKVWRTEPHTLELAGRETLPQVNQRVADLLDELTATDAPPEAPSAASPGSLASPGTAHGDGDTLVATVVYTHDVIVRAAVSWALGVGPEIYRHVEVANCSITTVRVTDGVRRLVRANDVAHLTAPSSPGSTGSSAR